MNALSLLNSFENEINRPFFRRSLSDTMNRNWLGEFEKSAAGNEFPSEMKYDDKGAAWSLVVELAGVTKENIKIDTTEGSLRLTGEKVKGVNTGKFEGLYSLPENVDSEKIVATFEDGILNILMPVSEKKLSKSIQIK